MVSNKHHRRRYSRPHGRTDDLRSYFGWHCALEKDIEANKQNGKPVLGSRVKGWLAKVGTYVGKETAKTGLDVIQKLATKWVLQHYGLDV